MGKSLVPRPIVRDTHLPNEIRTVLLPAELRADVASDPNSLGDLEIRFSKFNQWYRIESFWEGEFLERVAPGSFKQTIKEDQDGMRVLFNHGFDMTIDNKVLGPIRSLTEEADSPVGVVPLFDTSYNRDLLPGLKAGVYGSSFRMRVREEKWNDEPDPSDYNPKGLPERTITNVRLYEFGPVTFPANPGATASMRSATDDFMEKLAERNAHEFEQAVRSVRSVRPDFNGISARSGRSRARRPLSPRVLRALSGSDAATLQELLTRLAIADAAYDPIVDALEAADDALDDALITVSSLLGVPNPDPIDAEDLAEEANSATIPTGSPTRSGAGTRAERSKAEESPGNGETAIDPMTDPQQRHLLLRARKVI